MSKISHWRDISKPQLQAMLAVLKDLGGPATVGDLRRELERRGVTIEAIPTVVWEIGQNPGYRTSGGVRFPDGKWRYWLMAAPGWEQGWMVTKDFRVVIRTEVRVMRTELEEMTEERMMRIEPEERTEGRGLRTELEERTEERVMRTERESTQSSVPPLILLSPVSGSVLNPDVAQSSIPGPRLCKNPACRRPLPDDYDGPPFCPGPQDACRKAYFENAQGALF